MFPHVHFYGGGGKSFFDMIPLHEPSYSCHYEISLLKITLNESQTDDELMELSGE